MKKQGRSNRTVYERFPAGFYPAAVLFTFLVFCLCVGAGSVAISPAHTIRILWSALVRTLTGSGQGLLGAVPDTASAIILSVRVPRVLCAALSGASLSLCGAVMQGLLKNPLADGSTLGVSSGASLGAALAITLGITIHGTLWSGATLMAMLTAFLSMIFILSLAYRLDRSLSTNTIILLGIIFSMFISSVISLLIIFASEKIRTYTFWTLGSLAGTNYRNVLTLLIALVICGAVLMRYAAELNAYSIGEENAANIGVNIRRVRLVILIAVSSLIGVCVSISGTIGFVGLVTPHIMRMLIGPNHKRLLPASLFGGAVFLMLTDLLSRVICNPLELPVGVITSFVGAPVFTYIFYRTRSGRE
ncbi:MAG: iron ABC transporter permease [Lachnospiraceae bacterium]|nr:iron ABC transporter permease [Lachnospiraceae bacterium]